MITETQRLWARSMLQSRSVVSPQMRSLILYWAGDNRCCPLFQEVQSTIVWAEDIEGCTYRLPDSPVWHNEFVGRGTSKTSSPSEDIAGAFPKS